MTVCFDEHSLCREQRAVTLDDVSWYLQCSSDFFCWPDHLSRNSNDLHLE